MTSEDTILYVCIYSMAMILWLCGFQAVHICVYVFVTVVEVTCVQSEYQCSNLSYDNCN